MPDVSRGLWCAAAGRASARSVEASLLTGAGSGSLSRSVLPRRTGGSLTLDPLLSCAILADGHDVCSGRRANDRDRHQRTSAEPVPSLSRGTPQGPEPRTRRALFSARLSGLLPAPALPFGEAGRPESA